MWQWYTFDVEDRDAHMRGFAWRAGAPSTVYQTSRAGRFELTTSRPQPDALTRLRYAP